MTIHPSLKGVDTLVGDRSVLTRVERLQQLEKAGKVDQATSSAYGLPKVRTNFKVAKSKKALKAEEGADEKDE
ncbi:MAG: small basic protein (TIGR04137 family) [Planctomycetota bacterium]|jgi:small basic protein (TIGR04137 family)